MPDEGGGIGGVSIGAREIYDELVGMRAEVQNLAAADRQTADKLAVIADKLVEISADIGDHEGRIRSIEKWIWSAPAALITGMTSAVIVIFAK